MFLRQEVIWAVVLAFATLACDQQAESTGNADKQAIESLYQERSALIQGRDDSSSIAEAYVAIVAENAVWMPPNAPKVQGREAIQSWAEEFFGRYTIVVKSPTLEKLHLDGDLAVRRYSSVGEYIPKNGGDAVPYDQKYIDVLERDSSGSWRITHHMWSSNKAAPTVWQ